MKINISTLLTLLFFNFTSFGQEAPKPNIIFIFADDWGWEDLSCHDHPYVKTPNIDRLAKEGTDFHRFTVASAVCSPSRTAVMTGHFPSRYSIDGHFAWVPQNAQRGMPDWVDPSSPSMARIMQSAGYATAHFGKWHLSNNMIPDSPSLLEYGYDEYGAFNCSGEQMPYDHDVDRSIAFIEGATKESKPFFINLWIHEPHTPFHVIPKYRQQFEHLEDEADNIYAATLAYADERIGELLDYLDAQELTDNTLVIFSSDNGPERKPSGGEPKLSYDSATGAGFGTAAAKGTTAGRKGYKASLYEGGLNVPFLARWPGKIKAGAIDGETILSAVDLVPTFAKLGGAELPKGYEPDGVDQTPALLGEPQKAREKTLFWRCNPRFPSNKAYPDHWAKYAVLSQGYKLLANANLSQVELYDLKQDPLEKENCIDTAPKVLESMKAELDQWLKTLPTEPFGNVFSSLRNNESK